jgi:chemotaxis protein methyltransferase WspC
MQSVGLDAIDDYSQLIATSAAQWEELIEAVIVAETWFFRDPEAFTSLARFVFDSWLPSASTQPLRLLSLPCSSGEEPYSVAMTLLDAGLSPKTFHIDAFDISSRALARAEQAVYGKNSFRNKDLQFRDRYFGPNGEGFVLHPSVRRRVAFRTGNLIASDILKAGRSYDCIFCRNLLIYFDPQNQTRALLHLRRLLRPGGVLFVGPAEQGLALSNGFVTAGLPMALACSTSDDTKRIDTPNQLGNGKSFATGCAAGAGSVQVQSPAVGASLPAESPNDTGSESDDLERAKGLADVGRLEEAAAICEAYLQLNKDSAQGYYLLGLVRDALDLPSAAECYRKALYLEPNHKEALLHMALLAERNGDNNGAANLRRRAGRADFTLPEPSLPAP